MGFDVAQDRDSNEEMANTAAAMDLDPQSEAARGQADELLQAQGAAGKSLPKGVDLRSAALSFTLPKGLKLDAGSATLKTKKPTAVRASVDKGGLWFDFSPQMIIDVPWPAGDMSLSRVGWSFKNGKAVVQLKKTGGGMDFTGDAREAFGEKLTAAVKGTRVSESGYDPLQDANLASTLQAVVANVKGMGEGGDSDAEPAVDPNQIRGLGAEATVALKEGFSQNGLKIDAGGALTLAVTGAGSAGDIAGASDAGAAAMAKAAKLEAITFSSKAFHVVDGAGKSVADLRRVRVLAGGKVNLDDVSFPGGDEGTGFAALARALEEAATAVGQPRAATPTKAGVEKALSGAVLELINTYATVIPGVDLRAVFGS
jgi:hypothetical protein